MAKIPKDYIAKLRSSAIYKKFIDGIKKDQLNDIIVGKNPYSLSSSSDYVNQNASQVILYFHALADEKIINVNLLNVGLKKVKLNKTNTPLLLDYIYSALVYKKDNSLINVEVRDLWKKVKKSDSFDPKAREQQYLISKIHDLLPPEDLDFRPKKKIDFEEALKLFILAIIAKIPSPSTDYTITNFLNYKMDIFNNISPIISELKEHGLIKSKSDTFIFLGTEKAKKLLDKTDMNLVFEALEPEEDKLEFYRKYTELLK